ncbi:MAG: tetratricopeptide repeat protein, partial [Polyangiaceae bacterium]
RQRFPPARAGEDEASQNEKRRRRPRRVQVDVLRFFPRRSSGRYKDVRPRSRTENTEDQGIMRRAAQWGMLTWAVMTVPSITAHAGDRAEMEAEARFQEGLSRVKKHDFEAARLSFEQAYAVLHRPMILWNLALTEEKTGHPIDALGHFRKVAREAEAADDRANAQQHVSTLMAQTERVEVKAPPGAELTVDGGPVVATAPLTEPLDVTPGHHVIEALLDPQSPGVRKAIDVDASAGQVARISFMAADSRGPAPHPDVSPPLAPVAAPPKAPQPRPSREALVAVTGSEAKSFWTPQMIATTTLVGTAVVLVGLGIYFGVASQNSATTAQVFQSTIHSTSACTNPMESMASACADWDAAVRAQNRDATTSNVLYAAGGVMAATAIATFFLWPKQNRGTGAWVIPVGIGLGAGGRF